MSHRLLPVILGMLFIASVGAAESEGKVSGSQALTLLKEGNQRFLAGNLLHPHQDGTRRLETAKGQAPYAAILGCADSRAALDTVFDAGIGDLFTIRVAGNVADTDEIASLEYGAEHLHTPLILVLGHTSCGAVTAVVSKASLGGQLPGLLDNIQAPASRAVAAFGAGAKDIVDQAARENVLQSIQDMLSKSKILSELVENGELKIVGGLYHLDSGSVEWMENPPGLQAWKAAGLKFEPTGRTGAPQGAGGLISGLVTLLVAAGLLLLIQRAFVAQLRWVPGLKLQGRLSVSYGAIVLVAASGATASLLLSDPWPLASALAISTVFLFLYTRTHFEGIKAFVRSQRK